MPVDKKSRFSAMISAPCYRGTLTFAKTKNLRMKKIIHSLPLLAAFILIAAGCGNKANSSDPKVVLVEFMKRMSKKDVDGAAQLATKDSKSTMDMMKKGMEMSEKMKDKAPKGEADLVDDFKDVEFGEAKITGETAVVPFKNKKKDTGFEFPLKKEDGAWKVDFSMGTLMKMGMEQAGKKGGLDGMNESGEDIKSPEELKKSMETIDSMMKTIDPKQLEQMKKAMEKGKEN
jgi:Domain of unknown function (DUF4878)